MDIELSERLFNLAESETHGVSYAVLTRDGYIHLDGTTFTVDLLRKIISLVEDNKTQHEAAWNVDDKYYEAHTNEGVFPYAI